MTYYLIHYRDDTSFVLPGIATHFFEMLAKDHSRIVTFASGKLTMTETSL